LLIASDDQNILALTVMCGINLLFSFVYYIKSSRMASQNYWTYWTCYRQVNKWSVFNSLPQSIKNLITLNNLNQP